MEPWTFDPQVDPQAFAALGFAESSEGLARRQREYREGWWAHAERSKAFIMHAAMRARKHKLAVVLGAGKAYDLPLAELAKGFDRLILVDIDAKALASASAGAVPEPALRRKIELRVMDLTGVSARMAREIESSNSREELYASYRLASPPRLVPGDERADLLISALVLTQLALPFKSIAAETREAESRRAKAWDDFERRMQQDHIDALTGQADLAVLISETAHQVTAHVAGGSDRNTGESWSLIGGGTLEARIPESMEISGSNAWSWPMIRAEGRKPGARMDVTALSLRQRGSS